MVLNASLGLDRFPNLRQAVWRVIHGIFGERHSHTVSECLKSVPSLGAVVINKFVSPRHINIGGGAWFCAPRWRNLESVKSIVNGAPVFLTPNMTWDHRDCSIESVYSSHCFEHLDDATIDRSLAEAQRVLQPGGRIVIKVPDFDSTLAAYRRGDEHFFAEAKVIMGAACDTWHRRGVEPSLAVLCTMVLSNFWNSAYGDIYAGKRHSGADTAYFGPPVLDNSDMYESMLQEDSPHQIAQNLKRAILDSETDVIMGHQNAWSKEEFIALMERHGFRTLSTDPDAVMKANPHIPGVTTHAGRSYFYYGEKV